MPIRFSCPHCHQRLSVSSRKAGTAADCPRCHQALTIPDVPPEPANPLEESTPFPVIPADPPLLTASGSFLVAAMLHVEEPPATAPPPVDPLPAALPPPAPPPPEFPPEPRPVPVPPLARAGENAVVMPGPDAFEGIEVVFDAPAARPAPAAPPRSGDLIAVPRYVLYVQGGLIAVVALVAFLLGLLAGGAVLSPPAPPQGAASYSIRGSVSYASGPRLLPDEGAVVAVIPQTPNRPDDKAPALGLRPGDPPPGPEHKGIAVLRQLGGGYTRADAGGRFEVSVREPGRYLVLVVSHEKRDRGSDEIPAADLLELGPYFDDAAELLSDRRYQLTLESVRSDRQLNVAFE